MHDDISKKAMTDALAAYTGPVKQCPPGRARGDRTILKEAVRHLQEKQTPAIIAPVGEDGSDRRSE